MSGARGAKSDEQPRVPVAEAAGGRGRIFPNGAKQRDPRANAEATQCLNLIFIFLQKQEFIMEDGVYCSTAGTHFTERESLQEHYQSEFHRYVDLLYARGNKTKYQLEFIHNACNSINQRTSLRMFEFDFEMIVFTCHFVLRAPIPLSLQIQLEA